MSYKILHLREGVGNVKLLLLVHFYYSFLQLINFIIIINNTLYSISCQCNIHIHSHSRTILLFPNDIILNFRSKFKQKFKFKFSTESLNKLRFNSICFSFVFANLEQFFVRALVVFSLSLCSSHFLY